MSATSDERREVAEQLRKEANGYRRNRAHGIRTEIDLGDVPGVFQDITHFCGLHGTVRCEDMLDRLADLTMLPTPSGSSASCRALTAHIVERIRKLAKEQGE